MHQVISRCIAEQTWSYYSQNKLKVNSRANMVIPAHRAASKRQSTPTHDPMCADVGPKDLMYIMITLRKHIHVGVVGNHHGYIDLVVWKPHQTLNIKLLIFQNSSFTYLINRSRNMISLLNNIQKSIKLHETHFLKNTL